MGCCPPSHQHQDQSQIKQISSPLLDASKQKTNYQVTVSVPQKNEAQPTIELKKEFQQANKKIQKTKQTEQPELIRPMELSDDFVIPEAGALMRSGGLKYSDEVIRIQKRSQIWLQDAGTKIFYSCHQKDDEMLFTFKVNKHKIDQAQPMNYVLQPSIYYQKYKHKQPELGLWLITSPKSFSKFKNTLPQLTFDSHIKPIFGLFRPETEKANKHYYFENEKIVGVVNMSRSSVRMESIDKIIISLQQQKSYERILWFCLQITQTFDLQDLMKVTFILPAYLTLPQIGTLLSRLVRRYLISEKLQTIIKYLGYQIELLESTSQQFEQAIILSNNISIYQKEEMPHKQFEIKLELALGLLMIDIDNNNFRVYETLMTNFLMDKNIVDYLKFIQFVHKDKKEFIQQLEELKIFDQSQIQLIQKSKKIQQKNISSCQKLIIIKQKNKRRLGDIFRQYRTTKTPVEQLQKKKQWDDDLKANDIAATIMQKSSTYNGVPKAEAKNIFQIIDDNQIQKIDLTLLANQEQFQYDVQQQV